MDIEMHHYCMNFIGTKYRYNRQNPLAGFDCSGLMVECLRAFGFIKYNEDYSSQGLYNLMDEKNSRNVLVRGSLIFFGKNEKSITHVAMCVGNGLMIEAGGGGKTTLTEEDAALNDAFVRIRPINYRKDRMWVKKPRLNN